MIGTPGPLERGMQLVARHRGLILPVAAAGMIFVVLVPLPPMLMDVLLAANIALAAIILLTTIYVASPLEFSVFPSLLLGVTLFRLVLNVATTRLILTAGAEGRGVAEAQGAAGQVIWSFSEFVTSGSLPVGVILFTILIIIQFVVVTKGAARISEVAARFVLDAMPGKQMSIDADRNGGLVTDAEARQRRRRIDQEADFYGAMDGASKFLRGDAVAAVIITLVNILGGLYVGMVQYGWEFSRTVNLFTRLTIGDGLVAQVPAFIVSVSAALIVSRSTVKTNLGEEIVAQLTSRPIALAITAVFLGALMLTSLPKLPLLLLGVGCSGLAYLLSRRNRDEAEAADATIPQTPAAGDDDIERLLTVEPMQIEIGFALVPLVDPDLDGDLVERIGALRRRLAGEVGLVVPPIRISDNLSLSAHEYRIHIRGAKVGGGSLYAKQLLAVAGETAGGDLPGRETVEPAFGSKAFWIAPDQRDEAEAGNYTVVEPVNVLMTHLAETVRRHAADLLGRQQIVRMLAKLRSTCESLVDEVTDRLPTGTIHKVLGALLDEGVGIRDLETILEALGEAGDDESVEALTQRVRAALGRGLSQRYCGDDGKILCVSLAAELSETLDTYITEDRRGSVVTVPPDLTRRIADAVGDAVTPLRKQGRRPVVVCPPRQRVALRRMLGSAVPDLAVLGYNEIDSVEVHSVRTVGIES